jgi:hypothetical protein
VVTGRINTDYEECWELAFLKRGEEEWMIKKIKEN